MKKLLLASTALVLSAGIASAQGVTLSGDGRMGLVRTTAGDVEFTSRVRVTFRLSGETDMGVAFGGSFRADNAQNAARGTAGNVFVSGDFGRLAMGDVDGAALSAVGDLHMTSLTGLTDLNEMVYLSREAGDDTSAVNAALANALGTFNNLPRALYSYSIDGFSFFASIDNPSQLRAADGSKTENLRNLAVGASYTFEGFTGGIGYEDLRVKDSVADTTSTATHWIASVAYEFEGFEIKGIAGRVGGDAGRFLRDTQGASRSQYGVSAQGTFDEVTVSAFVNRTFLVTNYGIGASYDLGGGAAVAGGVARRGSNTDVGVGRYTVADFGLTFRF